MKHISVFLFIVTILIFFKAQANSDMFLENQQVSQANFIPNENILEFSDRNQTNSAENKNLSNNHGDTKVRDFCERLRNSPELKEYAGLLKKLYTKYDGWHHFETADNIVMKFIVHKPIKDEDIKTIAECAYSIRDSDLLYLMANEPHHLKNLKISFEKRNIKEQKKTRRIVDESGNIINAEILEEQDLPETKIVANAPWLLFFDQNGKNLDIVFPEIKLSITKEIAAHDKVEEECRKESNNKSNNKSSTESKNIKNLFPFQNQQSPSFFRFGQDPRSLYPNKGKEPCIVEAEARRKKEAIEKENSPESILTRAYQFFQIVHACHDVRNGYALVFINNEEFIESKKKIKLIEGSIKSKIKGEITDKLWSDAVLMNKSNLWYIKNSHSLPDFFIPVKNFCSAYQFQLNLLFDSIIGTEAPKKTF